MKTVRPITGVLAAMLLCVAGTARVACQDKPVLTVLDFEATGLADAEVRVFTDALTTYIVEANQYRVIDRRQRSTILGELEFSLADCTDESCQLKVGRLLSASHIVVGSVGKLGSRYVLNARLVSVETGETLNGVSETYASLDALVDDARRLTQTFLGQGLPRAARAPRVVRATLRAPTGSLQAATTTI